MSLIQTYEPTVPKLKTKIEQFSSSYDFIINTPSISLVEAKNAIPWSAYRDQYLIALDKILKENTVVKSIPINISSLFSDDLLSEIERGQTAKNLMNENEKREYEKSPDVFNAMALSLLENLLKDHNADSSLRGILTEWILLLLIKISIDIETNG